MWFEVEVPKYRNIIAMNDREYEALWGSLESAVVFWGTILFSRLPLDKQAKMGPGMQIRLDLINESHEYEVTRLLDVRATEKLRAMGKVEPSRFA